MTTIKIPLEDTTVNPDDLTPVEIVPGSQKETAVRELN